MINSNPLHKWLEFDRDNLTKDFNNFRANYESNPSSLIFDAITVILESSGKELRGRVSQLEDIKEFMNYGCKDMNRRKALRKKIITTLEPFV